MAASTGRSTVWELSDTAKEKRIPCPDITDLTTLMTCLGDAANSAFKVRRAAPVVFKFFTPARDSRRAETTSFFNWRIRYIIDDDDDSFLSQDGGSYDEDMELMMRQDGDEPYTQTWERDIYFEITFYNYGNAHIARQPGRAYKDKRVSIDFYVTVVGIVTFPDDPQQAFQADEAIEKALALKPYMPQMRFEQQNRDGTFLKLGDPSFVAINDAEEQVGRVITQEHLERAFLRIREGGMSPDSARQIVRLTYKDDTLFNPSSFDSAFDWDAEFSTASAYIATNEWGARAGFKSALLSVYTWSEPPSRRRDAEEPPPKGPKKPPKRHRTGELYRTFNRLGISTQKCAFCQQHTAIAVCTGCKSAFYCGVTCQTFAWHVDGHEEECCSSR